MIEVKWHGRFGNHVFIFCGSIRQSLINNHDIILNPSTKYTKDQFKKILKLNSFNFNYSQEITKKENVIHLDEYFQKPQDIEWVVKNRKILFNDVTSNDRLFIHVRSGDLINKVDHPKKSSRENRALGYSYYETAISQSLTNNPTKNKYISSDEPDSLIVKHLSEKFDLNIYRGNLVETILFGASSKYKILSGGTYSLIMGITGMDQSSSVYVPDHSLYKRWHPNYYDFLILNHDWIKISC
jgi:hypothetical protein